MNEAYDEWVKSLPASYDPPRLQFGMRAWDQQQDTINKQETTIDLMKVCHDDDEFIIKGLRRKVAALEAALKVRLRDDHHCPICDENFLKRPHGLNCPHLDTEVGVMIGDTG